MSRASVIDVDAGLLRGQDMVEHRRDEQALRDVEEKVRAAFDSVERAYPGLPLEELRDLVEVGEWKVAMECLFDNLSNDSLVLPRELYFELVGVGQLLGLNSRYWNVFSFT
jgi:hypothetical protein